MKHLQGPVAPRDTGPQGPARLAALSPRRLWAGLLAATAAVALLGAFHHVVQGGVGQGETRRREAAELADATWRCERLRDAQGRRACADALNRGPLPAGLAQAGAARPAVLPALAPRSDGAGTGPGR